MIIGFLDHENIGIDTIFCGVQTISLEVMTVFHFHLMVVIN